jgi:endonuclease/exonuclease/phosphatase family metal-dependent hydrolase
MSVSARRGRRGGFFIALAVAVAALALGGCNFVQYNIANGNSAPENHGQDDVIAMVRHGDRPVAFTLEEVCRHHVPELEQQLGPYGYHVAFHTLVPDGCGGGGYGDAIVYQGHLAGWPGDPLGVYTFKYTAQGRHPSGAMAVGIGAGSQRVIVWVTHLEASDDAKAAQQAAQLLDAARFIQAASGWPTVVGGDFNLTPSQKPMTAWHNHFHEADQGLNRPTSGSGKIDYLFSSIPWSRVAVYPSDASDHNILEAGIGN